MLFVSKWFKDASSEGMLCLPVSQLIGLGKLAVLFATASSYGSSLGNRDREIIGNRDIPIRESSRE